MTEKAFSESLNKDRCLGIKKRTQALVIVLSTVLGLFPGMPAYSNPEGDSEAGGIVAGVLAEARRQGVLDFPFHSGSNQCGSLSRFNRTRAVLDRAQTGSAAALRDLDVFIGASSMQRKCVRSISSGNFGALIDRLAEIRTTEYVNNRNFSRLSYRQYGLEISDYDARHWDNHRNNVGRDQWNQDFHRDVVQRLFGQCHHPIGNDLQHWVNHSFNVSPSQFVADVRRDWRCS